MRDKADDGHAIASFRNNNLTPLACGRTLLEVILALSLMAAISTVMFVRQVKQHNEMEEVTVAEGIRNLRDRLKIHVRNNTASYPPRPSPTTYAVDLASVFDGPVPEIYNGFKIALKVDPIRPGEARLPYHGFIVSPRVIKGRELSDLSASRIAAILGASGGVIPEKIGVALPGTALGTMNLWRMDHMGSYFSAADLVPPRVVVNLDFADINNDLPPDMRDGILFRKEMSSFPEASNLMEWDLRFAKNGAETLVIGIDGSITSGNFSVAPNGAVSTKSTLNVKGLATFGDSIYVNKETDTGTLNVRDSAKIGGALRVVGRADFNSDVRVNNSNLAVGKDLTVLGSQTVGGALHAGGNITTDGTVAARLAVVQGQPCKLGEMAVDNPVNAQAIPMSCIKGRWFPTGTDPDSCLVYSYSTSAPFKEKLFRYLIGDGTFTAPCSGTFNITAIGGGGGGGGDDRDHKGDGGSGGGSTAFYIFGQHPLVLAGGGGGSGTVTGTRGGGGASGEVEHAIVTLTKDITYTIKVGYGGRGFRKNEACSAPSGYNRGNCPCNYGRPNCNSPSRPIGNHDSGGNGADYKNGHIHGTDGNNKVSHQGGAGGYNSGTVGAGGAGYTISGKGTFGRGGGSSYASDGGAVYIYLPLTFSLPPPRVVTPGAPCGPEEVGVSSTGAPMACLNGKWYPPGTNTDSCNIDTGGFSGGQLFTSDGTFTVPCTGSFTITAVGGGGGGGGIALANSKGGTGGGSSAFYDEDLKIIAGGGGGASAYDTQKGGGASGEVETVTVDLYKGQLYTVKIGRGGVRSVDGVSCTPSVGYTRGYCNCASSAMRGCDSYASCTVNDCNNGGNGADYKNSSVYGADGPRWRGGYGGNDSGSLSGGAGYAINGAVYGSGGSSSGNGGNGAVYIGLD